MFALPFSLAFPLETGALCRLPLPSPRCRNIFIKWIREASLKQTPSFTNEPCVYSALVFHASTIVFQRVQVFVSNRSREIPFVVSTLIFNSSVKIRLTFRPESRELKKRRRERRRGARLKVALSKIRGQHRRSTDNKITWFETTIQGPLSLSSRALIKL